MKSCNCLLCDTRFLVFLIVVILIDSCSCVLEANAGEVTTNPITATVQVRYGSSSGTGTAIGPHTLITCAHIHTGEQGGQTYTVSKHWSDGSDHYRGYLLAAHNELDLTLIHVPEADFDYVLFAGETAAADQQPASWYGHAAAKPEILSFRGVVTPGYSTHFDLVRGHDSIEGQSGGGVFNAQGRYLGVMHGRPHTQPQASGGGAIFTPLRHIEQWIATQCQGGQCRPYLPDHLFQRPGGQQPGAMPPSGAGVVTPPPPRPDVAQNPPAQQPPQPGAGQQPPPACACDLKPVFLRIDQLQEQVEAIAKRPGVPGPPGPACEVDVDQLTDRITAKLAQNEHFLAMVASEVHIQVQNPEQPLHAVLVADRSASYWPRLARELERTRDRFSGIQVAPPPNFSTELPALVIYRGGISIMEQRGERDVTRLLTELQRGNLSLLE